MENFVEAMKRIVDNTIGLWAYGISGILLMFFGYWLLCKLTPHIDVTKELGENKNLAVAIVVASFILGVAVILAAIMLPWQSPVATPATTNP